MKNWLRLILGVVACLPLLVFLLIVGAIVYWIQYPSQQVMEWILTHPVHLLFINLFLFLATSGPLVFYIIHAGLNPGLADRKGPWILLMVFLGYFMMPVYWYQFVWHDSYYDAR